VINEQNCEFSDTVIIETPHEITWSLFPDEEATYQLGDTILLTAQTNVPEQNIMTTSWSTDDELIGEGLTTEVILVESGIYQVKIPFSWCMERNRSRK